MLKILLFFFAASLAANSAHAAEIRLLSREPIPQAKIIQGECNAVLTGEIEPGDANKIKNLDVQGVPDGDIVFKLQSDDEHRSKSICLSDSPGGNFDEALKILKVLRENGWATVVPRNGRCLSACAVAFLGGTIVSSNSNGGQRAPFRIMDITAKVGFHAPFLPPDARADQVMPVMALMNFVQGGILAIQQLDSALNEQDTPGAGSTFPKQLLLDMLSHFGGTDFIYVDTIDKAGAYNIRLAGVPKINVDVEALKRLCSNAVIWAYNKHDESDPPLTSWNYEICKASDSPDAFCNQIHASRTPTATLRRGVDITSRHDFCTISGGPNAGDDFKVRSHRVDGVEYVRYLEPWASLPHYVPLADLVDVSGQFDPRPYLEIKPFDSNHPNSVPLSAFLNNLPGDVLIMTNDDDDFGPVTISFGKDQHAVVIWSDRVVDKTTYQITATGACFDKIRGNRAKVCATMSADQDGMWHWSFGQNLPTLDVEFERSGHIDPIRR